MTHLDDATIAWRADHKVGRWLAWQLLHFAEWLLLIAYGWHRTHAAAASEAAWAPPDTHPKAPDRYGRTHAINSTRYYLRPVAPKRRRR